MSHPRTIEVSVLGGERHVTVRKWKMRERAILRPRLTELFEKVIALQEQSDGINLSLVSVFMHAEGECAAIAEASTSMPDDLKWDDLDWEDLPDIVQAVWSLNVAGGLMGKVGSLLGPLLSTNPTASKPSGQDFASSPAAGEVAPNSSSTN